MATVSLDQQLDSEQFVHIPRVPIFREHYLRLPDGRVIYFDRAKLQQIADNCNRRIEQTGDYATIVINHTGRSEDTPCVGFAGPFYVEPLPLEEETVWAITADFHIYRDYKDVLKHYPKRSVELYNDGPFEKWFLDPIALISKTPRLDLGLLYSRDRSGGIRIRYSAAEPGPTSVYVPEMGKRQRKTDYAAPAAAAAGAQTALAAVEKIPEMVQKGAEGIVDMAARAVYELPSESIDPQKAKQILHDKEVRGHPLTEKQRKMFGAAASRAEYEQQEAKSMALSKEDLDAIVQAFLETPVGQWIQKKMAAEEEGTSSGPENGATTPVVDAGEAKAKTEYEKEAAENAAEASIEALKEQIELLKKQLEEERSKRTDVERYSKLKQLRARFIFDLDKEFARCRRMNDQQFDLHVKEVIPNYKENPASGLIPAEMTDTSGYPTESLKYERHPDGSISYTVYGSEAVAKAVQLATTKGLTFEEALQQVVGGVKS
ncbi:MAG TPA: hypothetical protein PKI05_04810 [Thermogutta sp.]|nr:hypothetical protein [Thermogutta sp.]